MEQSKGHTGNNIVTVLMQAYHFTLQQTSAHINEVYAELMHAYIGAKTLLDVHSFGEAQLDADVSRYIQAMENWPIGNIVSGTIAASFRQHAS